LILNSKEQSESAIPSLVRAVDEARTWYEWVVNGQVTTMRQLAHKAGLDRHYASRIFRLVALSPELCEAVAHGEHSPLLTVTGLTDTLPLDWREQQLRTY
jgi:hypothetical protein